MLNLLMGIGGLWSQNVIYSMLEFKYMFNLLKIQISIPNFKSSKLCHMISKSNFLLRDFPGGTVVKNLPANAGDTGLSPGPGRFHMPRSN